MRQFKKKKTISAITDTESKNGPCTFSRGKVDHFPKVFKIVSNVLYTDQNFVNL